MYFCVSGSLSQSTGRLPNFAATTVALNHATSVKPMSMPSYCRMVILLMPSPPRRCENRA
jgi:hypothetical protein